MKQDNFKVYGYRWVMLLVFMFAVAVNQLLWITFASITGEAVNFYHVSDLSIGLLSMIFMIVYIVVSIPASWVIDTYGLRVGVGIGALLTGIFGLMRGLTATSYTWVLIAQIGIAIGQPFILNAVTTVAARWFPVRERATASGLGSLATYLGIFLGLALTPYLTAHFTMSGMLMGYGIASVAAAVVFLIFSRERPATPPCPPEMEARSLVLDGFKQMFRQKDFVLLLVIFFIGLGAFNAVTTWIEQIVAPRGFSSAQAGIIGGLMIVGGILGALVLPTLSDSLRKRTPFILLALGGATVGLVGVTFATSYWLLLTASFFLGFFLLSAGPIGFQYGAETTYPTPEGTSNGALILMGQISGIAFIFAMDSLKSPSTGSMTSSLVVLIVLMALCLILGALLKEPKTFLTQPAAKPDNAK
ncbi:MAG TPA: MFS transporter [Anaerolineales bacterium]|nr:MFS transporter [Anaerolineales bacterium]